MGTQADWLFLQFIVVLHLEFAPSGSKRGLLCPGACTLALQAEVLREQKAPCLRVWRQRHSSNSVVRCSGTSAHGTGQTYFSENCTLRLLGNNALGALGRLPGEQYLLCKLSYLNSLPRLQSGRRKRAAQSPLTSTCTLCHTELTHTSTHTTEKLKSSATVETHLHVERGANWTPFSLHSLLILSLTFLHRSITLEKTIECNIKYSFFNFIFLISFHIPSIVLPHLSSHAPTLPRSPPNR